MSTPIHILHLEDDPLDAELVQARLEEADITCRITVVQTRDEFEQMLRENTPDIILADYKMPMFDGMSALQLAKELHPEVPFLFVSGTMGEEAAVEALTKGATDYLLKHNLSRLASAVQRALQEAHNKRERRQAEEALELSEVKMRTILDSVDECFIVIDRDYRILSANRAFCDRLKSDESQIVGKKCHEVLFHRTQPCPGTNNDCLVERTFATGKSQSDVRTTKDASGALCYLELHSYPITDTSETITSVIETIIDVTEKHKLQEQLTQAQKLESIARLAGGVAHDFNNMLSVILGRTELALVQLDSSQPLYEDLKKIRRAAERSATLVRQLLAFARKQTVSPRVLNLNETVADILKMLRPLIGEAINLVWQPGDALLMVKMDSSQIDQILVNLCVNASDAIDGIGKITIETNMITIASDSSVEHSELIPGDYVLLTVRDDGCGMARETAEKIFDPFFTTKGTGKGTGLGLATVYGIVKQNKGFINVSSEPGQGTVFNIYLPKHRPERGQAQQQDLKITVPTGHETILLVEDEPTILDMTQQMLEGLGYRVLSASRPSMAIRLAEEHAEEVHLLLVDVVMPEMNGRDVAKQVKDFYPQIECLFMSGHSGDVIDHHGILNEKIQFLQKPFSIQNLATRVRQILDDAKNK